MNTRAYDRLAYTASVLVDVLVFWLASTLAWYIRYDRQWFRGVEPGNYQPLGAYVPLFATLTVVLLVVLHLNGVYASFRGIAWVTEMSHVANGVMTSIVLLMAITFGLQPLAFSRLLFLYDAVLLLLLLGTVRLLRRALAGYLRSRGFSVDRMLILGSGDIARTVMRTIVARPELGYEVVGFLSDNGDVRQGKLGRFKQLGRLDDLPQVLEEEQIDDVIICLPWREHDSIMSLTRTVLQAGARPRIAPDIFQLNISRVDVDTLGAIPLLGVRPYTISQAGQAVKRVIDVSLTLLALLLGAPLLLLIALFIRLDSPGPVLFTQTRVGQHGKHFMVYKFRSMYIDAEARKAELEQLNEADGPLFKIKDDPRRTRVGRYLRRLSLDELPQLLNVLRGDMSLVGPRPPLPDEVAQYDPWHRQRLEVKPGISGLAQVSGRSELTFDESVLLDIYYIENWSLGLDLNILLRTVPRVISGDGAY